MKNGIVTLPRGPETLLCEGNMTDLMSEAFRHLLVHPKPNAVLNIESHLFNVTMAANRCVYDFDMGRQLWLNRQRWSRLIKEYIDAAALKRFISQAQEIFYGKARKGATANMIFRDPDRYAKKHRWGGCLMGATFRGEHGNYPTITFHSRTTYIGYMAFLDAAIAAVLADLISENRPEDVQFRWHISSMQLHCFKSLPYVYSQPSLMAVLKTMTASRHSIDRYSPTLRHMAKWYFKVVDAYEEYGVDMLKHEKYGPFRRIKRRWLEYQGYLKKNLPPSCPVSSLNFDKAYVPEG